MRYCVLLGAVLSALLILSPQAFGRAERSEDAASERAVYALDEIIVTGTAAASLPFDAPSDIEVLSGREKLERQRPSLGASIAHLPGIDTINTGSQVGKPVIRGLTGNRILVLQNGIGLDYQQYGVRHPPNVEPLLAERIEVVQGAASILYGSSAIGGAVNIIPRSLAYAERNASDFAARLSTGYATNNEESGHALEVDGASGPLGLTGAVVYRNSGNLETPDADTAFAPGIPGDNPRFAGELDHTDYEQLNGGLRVGYRLDAGEITGRYEGWRSEQNFLLPTGGGIGQNLENDLVQFGADIRISEVWTAKPVLSYVSNLRQANAPGDPLPVSGDPPIDIEKESYTMRLVFAHAPVWLGLEGQAGLEFLAGEQESRGEAGLTPGGDIRNYSVFILERRDFGSITAEAGLRYDHRDQEADPDKTAARSLLDRDGDGSVDGDLDHSYDVGTASLGFVYRMTDHLAAAVNVGRGFRAPDLFELYADGVHGGVAAVQKGDPGLDPETSINSDFSLRWRSEKVRAKFTLYRNAISDYIFLGDTGETAGGLPVFSMAQADALLYGGDFSATWNALEWLRIRPIYELVRGELDGSGDDLPLLPADKLSLEARLHAPELGAMKRPYLQAGLRYAFDKDAAEGIEPFGHFDNKPFGTASTDAYTVVDLKAGFRLGRLGFSIAVENLLDETYRDFLDTYKGYALSPGRDFRFTADCIF
jgi:iron complex outermembrane receptor protein/hemoglobin/transferrin/lactoferrin receptor protein